MSLETYIVDVIEGRRNPPLLKGILLMMSQFFKAGMFLYHFAFDTHLMKRKKAELPVISVGNIIAGGSGKTPFVEKIG
ncbi:MAG: tetraacyldisaccharide 4'-kinase, partial [Simkania negevensis]|nr:tetraacyldisaccharide 4'-kinase [Simkania negevensis]